MKYFSLAELAYSERAQELGIDNTPTPEARANLIALIDAVLDPAREALGLPITVNSGYRCEQLNNDKKVRGSKTSQHLTGQAADIVLGSKSTQENKQLHDWIASNCEFDQLINEYNYSWVHVSYRRDRRNRKELLKIG